MSLPFSKLAAAMRRLPSFMHDNLFETTESGHLSRSSNDPAQKRVPAELEDALLITARRRTEGVGPESYALLLDVDIRVEAVESSSGNTHLYFDTWMTKEQHDAVIDALYKAGIVQKTWAESAMENENGSHLRPPWVRKDSDLTLAQQEQPVKPVPPPGPLDPIRPVTEPLDPWAF